MRRRHSLSLAFAGTAMPFIASCTFLSSLDYLREGRGSDGGLSTEAGADAAADGDVVEPNDPGHLGSVVAIAVYGAACAARRDGSVVCWGPAESGQLGTEPRFLPTTDAGRPFSATPIVARNVTGAIDVAVTGGAACARDAAGTVVCWGVPAYGQTGRDASPVDFSPSPSAPVVTSQGAFVGATQLVGKQYGFCALGAADQVFCWGSNDKLQTGVLGAGEYVTVASPSSLGEAIAVARGHNHSCSVTRSGEVACVGSNEVGQLGAPSDDGGPLSESPARPTLTRKATGIACGDDHTCVLDELGELICWGRGEDGQTGDASRSAPHAVALPRKAVSVAAGARFTCALLETGEVACFGQNDRGELGRAGGSSPSPEIVTGLPKITAIAAGSAAVCALSAERQVYCWGDNSEGALGDGTTASRFAPAKVIAPQR